MTVILYYSKEMTHPHMMVEDPYLIKSPFATLTTIYHDIEWHTILRAHYMVASDVKGEQVVEIRCSLRNLNTYCISVYIWSKIYCDEWMGLLTGTCNTSPPDKIGISWLVSSTQLGFLHIPGARWWGSDRWKRKNKYWYKTCMNWIKRFEGGRLKDMLATGQAI